MASDWSAVAACVAPAAVRFGLPRASRGMRITVIPAHSANIVAKVPNSDATPSPSANGGSVGGPSGWPLMCAKPLIDSATVPNPGRGL